MQRHWGHIGRRAVCIAAAVGYQVLRFEAEPARQNVLGWRATVACTALEPRGQRHSKGADVESVAAQVFLGAPCSAQGRFRSVCENERQGSKC